MEGEKEEGKAKEGRSFKEIKRERQKKKRKAIF